jgi:hypothetical protein
LRRNKVLAILAGGPKLQVMLQCSIEPQARTRTNPLEIPT